MNTHKLRIGVALTALIAASGTAPAFAFDNTNWTWELSRVDKLSGVSNSTLNALPNGNATVETAQTYAGDTRAQSDATANLQAATSDAVRGLGQVESLASAYGNVQSVASDVPLTADISQVHVGKIGSVTTTTGNGNNGNGNGNGNANGHTTTTVDTFAPQTTTAIANATGVQGATAASTARAMSNSVNVELGYAPPEAMFGDASKGVLTNGILAANIDQFSAGNMESRANTGVSIPGYDNIGLLDRPVSAASATSIGNLANTLVHQGAFTGQ